MQPKAGGKLHLRLNTGTRPIVDNPPGGFNSAGQGRPLGVGGSPRGTSPRCWLAPAGRISSAAVRRDRLWVSLEMLVAKVARGFGCVLYSALRPDLAASHERVR
ncbi:hypothetical protein JOQ06_022166 [Pogonophryne albipinna]|uniref:Uncharacterized protein n=1 Tax=Pogonophryne albipinna TaxID=1090488 RepID=A0AAD6A741_9TELE|nr:hypothetical protein JOQ06_022166 [Pogonophryne albipinna]